MFFFFFFYELEFLGIRQNHKKVNEHNIKIGEKIQSLRSHQQVPPTLPSPILCRSTNVKPDVIVAPAQSSSRKIFFFISFLNKEGHLFFKNF
jgi:hypothetical protein